MKDNGAVMGVNSANHRRPRVGIHTFARKAALKPGWRKSCLEFETIHFDEASL